MDRENIGEEIRKWRGRLGLSLVQFGKLINVPAASVSRWEKGVRPSDSLLAQIALVLGLWRDVDSVYHDLRRQGITIDEKRWETYAKMLKAALPGGERFSQGGSIDTVFEEFQDVLSTDFQAKMPARGEVIVLATAGLLTVIAEGFFSGASWKRFAPILGIGIGPFLFKKTT